MAPVAGADEDDVAALDRDALGSRAGLQIGGGDDRARRQFLETAVVRHVEEDAGGDDRGDLFDGTVRETARTDDRASVYSTVEHLRIGLVADGVDVGAAVFHADDDTGGAAAAFRLARSVTVAMAAVEEVGIPRLVRLVDRHSLEAGHLQVEDPHRRAVNPL